MGSVYFIRSAESVKVGYAKDVVKRLGELQIGNPVELRLLVFTPGTPKLERAFHAALQEFRVRGEWFSISEPSPIHKITALLRAGARPKTAADIQMLIDFNPSAGYSYGPDVAVIHGLWLPDTTPAGIDIEKRNAAILARQLKRMGLTSANVPS